MNPLNFAPRRLTSSEARGKIIEWTDRDALFDSPRQAPQRRPAAPWEDWDHSDSDPLVQGLEPSLCLLTHEPMRRLLPQLLNDGRIGLADRELSNRRNWSEKGENLVLVTLACAARVGLIKHDGEKWLTTALGSRFLGATHAEGKLGALRQTALEYFRTCWGPELRREVSACLNWAWQLILEPRAKKTLLLLVNRPAGFAHSELEKLPFGVAVAAAATAVGAVQFTGFVWKATLGGAWLVRSPKSPLNESSSGSPMVWQTAVGR